MTNTLIQIKRSLKEVINYLLISKEDTVSDMTKHYPSTLENNLSFSQIHTYIPIPFSEYLSQYPLFSHFVEEGLTGHKSFKKTQNMNSKKKYN